MLFFQNDSLEFEKQQMKERDKIVSEVLSENQKLLESINKQGKSPSSYTIVILRRHLIVRLHGYMTYSFEMIHSVLKHTQISKISPRTL